MADQNIVIGIELDDGSIKKAQVNVDQVSRGLGRIFSENFGRGIDRSFTGLIVQFTAIKRAAESSFRAVSGVYKTAIAEAVGAEKAVALFNATLANSGKFSAEASKDFQDFAQSLQEVGVVGAGDIVSASTALVSIGRLSGESLKQATRASLDFAAGLQIDVSTAFDLVSKAAAGNTGALSRYGIVVDKNLPSSQRFADVLRQINDRFGGLNQASANTFGGSLIQLQENLKGVFQAVGEFFTRSASFVALIKTTSSILAQFGRSLTAVGSEGDFLRGPIDQLLILASTLNSVALGPLVRFGQIGKLVFNGIVTGVQAAIVAISSLGSGAAQILGAVGVISRDTANSITLFANSAKEQLGAFTEQNFLDAEALTQPLEITAQVDKFIGEYQRAVTESQPITQELNNSLAQASQGAVDQLSGVEDRAKQFGQIVNQGLTNGVSQGIQKIVGNLRTGKNAFDGFVAGVLGIIGDMAIQIGTTLVGIGIGIDAIKASLLALTGGPAIAAGIALIAVGALLKSLSSGEGGGAPVQTIGTAPGGGPEFPSTGQPELDRNRGAEVAINIQGNVLDRRETGLEIATVLQEFFDTNDGVLARA
jgi:hypothetical protein